MLVPYSTSEKVKNAIAAAQSFRFNHHNHEDRWHAPYSLALTELTAPFDNIFVQVQYDQYLKNGPIYHQATHTVTSSNIDTQSVDSDNTGHPYNLRPLRKALPSGTDETDEDAFDSDYDNLSDLDNESIHSEYVPDTPSELDSESDSEQAHLELVSSRVESDDEMNASTISSQSVHSGSVVRPDLALLHVRTKEMDDHPQAKENETEKNRNLRIAKFAIFGQNRFHRQIWHYCTFLQVELKRNIPRSLEMKYLAKPGRKFQKHVDSKVLKFMSAAQSQLVEYFALAFRDYPQIRELSGIAGVGQRYRRITLTRENLPGWDFEERSRLGLASDFKRYRAKFGDELYLGSPESDADFNELRDNIIVKLAQLK
ncbi:hypothetical protein EV360DRAFT_81988 [Lentinula raphanica]|nr:hypothetical protein EV360DRAFT_81988 [Lentinula raphanica]